MKHGLTLLTLTFAMLACLQASATTIEELQHDWAVANYQLSGDEKKSAFERLANKADQAVNDHPGDAGILIWNGIIKSTWAGAAGGLGALKLVKAARSSLEQAMAIDDDALDGSAYTSLGALYYQVPGWPIAFGNDKKAREFLEKAVSINPDGIDSNYFYGQFLIEQKEYDKARQVLNKALRAPARPGRELADTGRREEIRQLLAEL